MDQVSKSAKGFATAGSLLNGETGLVNQYTSFVNDLVGMDSEYPLQFDLEINKTVYTGTIESALGKGYKNLKDGILAGTLGSEDVTDFLEESNLVSLYETDIESYATKVQDYLERTVRGLLTNTGSSTPLTPADLDQVDKNYEVAKGLFGDEDKYPCTNITEIDRWYDDAITFVKVGDPSWESSDMANLASSETSKYLAGVKARIEDLKIEQSGAWVHNDLWNDIKTTLDSINDGELTLTGDQKAAFVQSGIKVDDNGKVSYNLTSVDGINEYFADVHKVYTNLSESAVVYRPISNEAIPVFKDAIEAIKVTDANKASIIDSVAEDILAVIDEWTDNDTKGGNAIDKNDIIGCLEFDNVSKPTKINIDLVEVMQLYTQKPIGFTFTDGKIGGKDALTAKGMEDVKKAFFEAIKGIDGVANQTV